MFRLAPIDEGFVPYSRCAVRKHNAGLFVGGGKRGRDSTVVLQQGCGFRCDTSPCRPFMACAGPGDICVPCSDPSVADCPYCRTVNARG